MGNDIFRGKALEKLNSPEELDRVMFVLDSKMWIAMLVLGLGILGVVLWGFYGTMPYKVNSAGIIVKGSGITSVPSDIYGNIQNIFIRVGDVIDRGQVIATVSRPDLLEKLRSAKKNLEVEREKSDKTVEFNQNSFNKVKKLTDNKIAALNKKKNSLKLDVKFLKESIEKYEKLIKDGLVTEAEYEDAKAKLRTSEINIEDVDVDIELARSDLNKEEIASEKEKHDMEMQLKTLKAVVEEVYVEYKNNTTVVSSFSGKVVELRVMDGDYIQNGSSICTVEQYDKKLSALIFVNASQAKKIKQRMPVQISPSSIEKSEFGAIISFVTSVGQYPVSQETLSNYLGNNDILAGTLVGRESVVAVRVDMLPDSKTATGFKWSSSKGPDNIEINSGTLCSSTITVKERMPITLLFPFLKDILAL